MGVIIVIAKRFDALIGPGVMLLYPLYASLRAIESPTMLDDQQWLTYWIIYSLITIFELSFWRILAWLPFWPYIKLLFCMWLVLPMFSGAAYIYSNFVRKYVKIGMNVGGGTTYTDEQRRVLQMMSLDARKSVQDYVDRFGWDSVEKAIKAVYNKVTSDQMETKNENSDVSRAEEMKNQANEAFKGHKFSNAIDLYTKAIELNGNNAVYWANRAFAHTKLEEYGSAIQDASKAIEIDPKYSKGYYRRGAAYLAMGKFKDALKDFQQVKRICPSDPDAARKLKECEKAVMKLKFEEAISAPVSERRSVAESIDYHTIGNKPRSSSFLPTKTALAAVVAAVMVVAVRGFATTEILMVLVSVVLGTYWWGSFSEVEPQYSGARIEGEEVTLEFVKQMMDDFKNQKTLHKRYAYQIVLKTRQILQALPSLVDISVPNGKHFTVCGDVHGQFYDLLNIFELNGLPSEENPYLFNGDFVDRGSFSVEIILTLFAIKCMSPSSIYLARGNHESKSMNKIYGFEGEVRSKLSEKFVDLFAEVFCYLPLAHVINEKIFVVHGGLFSVDGVKLSDIRAIDRFCEPPEEGLMCELLWSDPQPLPGRGPSKRGVGLSFGGDVTKRFLEDNNLDLVVRSHEVKDEGYEVDHDGKLITVFSAPNYCDQMGNKGAFIRFEAPDMKPNIVTFSAVPHPDVKPMAYANNFMRMFN
ncbi:unnamed protein product [Brassica napus]|uniref:Serine/threonine-protein phosphatase 5 n=1 Tax=Brassica napus TaxID=3708 RepID=A0A817AR24_BRANA|nr:unnamed protein product [Brassica napus]